MVKLLLGEERRKINMRKLEFLLPVVIIFQQISVEIFRISLAAAFIAVQDDLWRAEAGSKTGVHRCLGDRGESQHGSVWSLAEHFIGAVQDLAFIKTGHWGRRLLASAFLLEEKAGHGFT